MENSWQEVKLGQVLGKSGYIRGPFGSALRRNELQPSGIPVYEQQHAIYDDRTFRYFIDDEKHKELYRFTVKPNDLIISCSGTLGRVSIIKENDPTGIISQALLLLRPDTRLILPKFLYYFFRSPKGFQSIVSVSSGSVQVNIAKRSDVENVRIDLPPLSEQRAIAGILGALDDKIELNRRMNRTLESIARAVFRQWFVGGEEKDWEEKPLDEIASFLNGLALQKYPAEENGEYLPVIKIAQLRKNDTTDADTASPNIPGEYIVDDGDVLFSWSGSLEVVIWCGGKGALNQHLFKVTSQNYPKWFYYLWTKHHLPEFRLIAAGKATTMGHIQRHHLHQATVITPPEKELKEMDKVMSPILELIINNEKESCTLASLRDSLLPKLMKGEVRVKEIEKA